MAYVPLYGRVRDNQGYCRSTSCLRGRVDEVSFWLNSWFGSVMNVSAKLVDGRDVVTKPDLRKVAKPQREAVKQSYEKAVQKANKVTVDIELKNQSSFEFRINGVVIDCDSLKCQTYFPSKKLDSFQSPLNAEQKGGFL